MSNLDTQARWWAEMRAELAPVVAAGVPAESVRVLLPLDCTFTPSSSSKISVTYSTRQPRPWLLIDCGAQCQD